MGKEQEKHQLSSTTANYLYEALLSATFAFIVYSALIYSNNWWWSAQFTGWVMTLNKLIGRGLYQSNFGIVVAYFVPPALSAIILFALLHLVSRNSTGRKSLSMIGGVLAILAPASLWWFIRFTRPAFFIGFEQVGWLQLELCIALVCVLLFMRGYWPITVWTSVVLLTLHAALWLRAYAITAAFSFSEILAVPVLSYMLGLFWGASRRHAVSAR